ncbi:MAG: hypothetical protein OXI38_02260 [Bacteroidota bacterium]|nr:hypothetical protein [Bacteroidota bacterium]
MQSSRATLIIASVLLFAGAAYGQDQEADVSQRVMPAAEVYDLEFIRQVLEDQILFPENDSYTSAVFLDVTQDGFGINDLLVLEPNRDQFLLSATLPQDLLSRLSALNLEEDYRLQTVRGQSAVVTEEAEMEENARKAMAGSVLRTLGTYYSSGPLEMYVRQQNEEVNITIWGYDSERLTFVPNATRCIAPPSEPMLVEMFSEPTVRSYLDYDGCVVVENWTADGKVVSRSCN